MENVTVIYKAKSKKECWRILHLLDMVCRVPKKWEIHYILNRVASIELTY